MRRNGAGVILDSQLPIMAYHSFMLSHRGTLVRDGLIETLALPSFLLRALSAHGVLIRWR
jgi:hypothetical protein